jgi:hypothetical protein
VNCVALVCFDAPCLVITRIFTWPGSWAGAWTSSFLLFLTVTWVASVLPNSTRFTSVRPLPLRTTTAPPAVDAVCGVTRVTDGFDGLAAAGGAAFPWTCARAWGAGAAASRTDSTQVSPARVPARFTERG